MKFPVNNRLMQRLALAYHRTQDRILLQRGAPFWGTPAGRYRDIATYITHAAINHLEGLPVPRGLGRPGIADHAWFASRQSAAAMGCRHGGYRSGNLFHHIMRGFPLETVLTADGLVESGTVGPTEGLSLPYWVYAAERTVVRRHTDGHDSGETPVAESTGVAVEHRLYAVVRLKTDIVGAVIFQRDPGSDLYRIAYIGMRRRWDHPVSRRRRRLAHTAFKRFNAAIRHWPGVTFDFIGAAEPEAAAMGYSLFRHLRALEMTRLKSLAPEGYAAERRRVTSYRYPVFPREAVATPGQTLKAMLMETPRWVLRTCRLAHRRSWQPLRRTA